MNRLSIRNKQSGLSLIELMVSMVIGLFIIIGISSVYLTNKRSSITTDELSLLQMNGRAVLEELTNVVQHTGYKATRNSLGQEMFILGPVAESSCVDDATLFSSTQNDVDKYGDTIGVVYYGDDSLTTDCTGAGISDACRLSSTTPDSAAKIYNYFKADVNADGNPVLTCSGSLSNAEVEIAEGVENLQLSYGEDTNYDGIADRFLNADDVADWGSIVSINVAVLVRSLRPVAATPTKKSYQLLDDKVIPTDDKFLRAVFTTTIRLRNATS